MNKLLFAVLRNWLPLAVAVSGLSLVIFGVAQQSLRLSANNPQIQLAEDMVPMLNAKAKLAPTATINMAESLAPFVTVVDKTGKVVVAGGELNDKTPVPPTGVLSAASTLGEDRVTWQPQGGVRIAAVVVPYDNGYVIAGRNLREVEKLADKLFQVVLAGWLVTLLASFMAVMLLQSIFNKK